MMNYERVIRRYQPHIGIIIGKRISFTAVQVSRATNYEDDINDALYFASLGIAFSALSCHISRTYKFGKRIVISGYHFVNALPVVV